MLEGTQPRARILRRTKKEDYVLSQSIMSVAETTAGAHFMNVAKTPSTDTTLLTLILTSLDEMKAEEIVTIPLAGKSEMADHMVVCSGRSSRQVVAIAEKLSDTLKHEMEVFCKLEGKDQGDWVLLDAGDAIIHVFRPEVREFYQLEKMWMDPSADQSGVKPANQTIDQTADEATDETIGETIGETEV